MGRRLVTELRPGDRVNLAHDPIADPSGRMHSYHFGYAVVQSIRIGESSVFINFIGDYMGATITFPITHKVKMVVSFTQYLLELIS